MVATARPPLRCLFPAVVLSIALAAPAAAEVHPNETLAGRLASHDPGDGPLAGAGFSFQRGTDEVLGSATGFGSIGIDSAVLNTEFGVAPGDFDVTDFQADTFVLPLVTRRFGFESGIAIQNVDSSAAVSIVGHGGAVARFVVNDPTRAPGETIGMLASFAANADIALPASRDSASFTVAITTIAESTAPVLITTGIWEGSYASDNAFGLLGDPGVSLTANDVGDIRTRSIAGTDVMRSFGVPNGGEVDATFTVDIEIMGPAGGLSTDAITFTGLETFSVVFEPAPGFDAAQLRLVPLPGAVVLFAPALLVMAAAVRRRCSRFRSVTGD